MARFVFRRSAALSTGREIYSRIGAPIVVAGRLWGAMASSWSAPERMPIGIDGRVKEFTELVATAVANADGRAQLTASRARIVTAADDARQRIERDLHDGTQQRLVSLALELRGAEATVRPEQEELRAQLAHVARGLAAATEDLQRISRGIHPAILSEGGLGPALKTLARRSAIPVELDVRTDRRLPQPAEVAAYYVVSEALTNAAKHARASTVHVGVTARDTLVELSIRDDGVGGADAGRGSGLIGLTDRVEALGGDLEIASPAGSGTFLHVEDSDRTELSRRIVVGERATLSSDIRCACGRTAKIGRQADEAPASSGQHPGHAPAPASHQPPSAFAGARLRRRAGARRDRRSDRADRQRPGRRRRDRPAARLRRAHDGRVRRSRGTAAGTPLDRLVTKLLTRALVAIVGLDAVGLAIGCALRRRRGHAADTRTQAAS